MEGLTVLAIGGNAIGADSYKKEGRNIQKTLTGIEDLIQHGTLSKPLIITHGNGPQVGRILEKFRLPLWLITGQTQG